MSFQLINTGKIFKTLCEGFLRINESRDILAFDDFTVPKFALQNKTINKTQTTTKTKKNSNTVLETNISQII